MSGEVYALIDLGWDNDPAKRPAIDAALKGCTHKREHTVKGPPFRGTEHIITCRECRFTFRYDSSD